MPIISFAEWVKRRRRAAFALVREGDLVEVKVTQALRTSADGPHTSARVELPDGALATRDYFAHTEALTEGAVNPALVLAANVCLVFVDGDATPAKLRLSSRLRVSSSGTGARILDSTRGKSNDNSGQPYRAVRAVAALRRYVRF